MAKKKRAATKEGRSKITSGRLALTGKGKFHGWIEVVPATGEPIGNDEGVVVALRSLEFGDIPDPWPNEDNEISLIAAAETDKVTEGQVSGQAVGSLKFDLIRYVQDGQALNIRDLVIFSGKVHRHLTLRCAVDELDKEGVELTKQLITEVLGLAKDLASDAITKTLLGGLPGVFAALLSFNKDDQVLVLNHSFYTKNVKMNKPDESRLLRSGVYTFAKRRIGEKPPAKPQVKMEIEVLTVEGSSLQGSR